jgi:hypothetical protein
MILIHIYCSKLYGFFILRLIKNIIDQNILLEGEKMADFCSCGSIILDGSCTNKSCEHRVVKKKVVRKKKKASTVKATKPAPEKKTTRRSSKCVTYPLSELEEKKDDKKEDKK